MRTTSEPPLIRVPIQYILVPYKHFEFIVLLVIQANPNLLLHKCVWGLNLILCRVQIIVVPGYQSIGDKCISLFSSFCAKLKHMNRFIGHLDTCILPQ